MRKQTIHLTECTKHAAVGVNALTDMFETMIYIDQQLHSCFQSVV